MDNVYYYAKCLEDLEDNTLTSVIKDLRECKTTWDVLKVICALKKSVLTVHQVLADTIDGILNGDEVYPSIKRQRRTRDYHYHKLASVCPLGEQILERAKELDMTQTAVAEYIGVSSSTLSRWIHGELAPNKKSQENLKRFLEELY